MYSFSLRLRLSPIGSQTNVVEGLPKYLWPMHDTRAIYLGSINSLVIWVYPDAGLCVTESLWVARYLQWAYPLPVSG